MVTEITHNNLLIIFNFLIDIITKSNFIMASYLLKLLVADEEET